MLHVHVCILVFVSAPPESLLTRIDRVFRFMALVSVGKIRFKITRHGDLTPKYCQGGTQIESGNNGTTCNCRGFSWYKKRLSHTCSNERFIVFAKCTEY